MKPWADPTARDPFIWIFTKDDASGASPIKRAPKNFFHRNELYTRIRPDGERDLSLERFFSMVEKAFNQVRRDILFPGAAITPDAKRIVASFVAIQAMRTPLISNHHIEQMSNLIDHVEQFEVAVSKLSNDRRRSLARLAPPSAGSSRGMTKQDLMLARDQPFHRISFPMMQTMMRLLPNMCLSVVSVSDERGFITTDAPATIFDPAAYRRPPLQRAPGLMYKTVEVALPISPQQLVLFHWKDDRDGYFEPPGLFEGVVLSEYNRRARFMCDEHFVVNGPTVDPIWFKEFPPPADSWEAAQSSNSADAK